MSLGPTHPRHTPSRVGALLALFSLGNAALGANPAESFSSWSAIPTLDLSKLAAGKVATETNSSMRFARGLSGQAAFVLDAPPEACTRVLLSRDPTKHSDLAVYHHRAFVDDKSAPFDGWTLDRRIGPVKDLLESVSSGEDLQLSGAERSKLPKSGAPNDAVQFFSGVLRGRWQAALRGDLGKVDSYDTRAEIKSLLGGEPKVGQHFADVLRPLTDPAVPFAPAQYYWDLSKVNGTATVQLGAIFIATSPERTQVVDVVFYASSGYLTSVTISELLPITLDGRQRSLCWQGSMVSSTELTGAFGVKRTIAAMLMKRELEQAVRLLQQDVAAGKR